MHNYLLVTLLIACGCSTQEPKQNAVLRKELLIPELFANSTKLPLYLDSIYMSVTAPYEQLADDTAVAIQDVISNYYFHECNGDSSETYFSLKDTYIGTLHIKDSSHNTYLILLRNPSNGMITSKILFYKVGVLEFNIHAMYEIANNRLKASSLKELLLKNTPDITYTNRNYELTRLWHNGTSNAIEKLVITVNKNKIDTVSFDRKQLQR